jgi:SAM-dependent methyltransferase
MTEPFWEAGYSDAAAPGVFGPPSEEIRSVVARLPAAARVLDLGCGDGRNALLLLERGFRVTAIDVSQRAGRLGGSPVPTPPAGAVCAARPVVGAQAVRVVDEHARGHGPARGAALERLAEAEEDAVGLLAGLPIDGEAHVDAE